MQLLVQLKQLLCQKMASNIEYIWSLLLVEYVHCYKLRVININKIALKIIYIYIFMFLQQKKIIPFVDVMKEKVK